MVLAAATLWGTLGIFARVLYRVGVTPAELTSVRASVGAAGLLVWMLAQPRNLRIRARDIPFFALYGLVSIALFQYAYFATVEHTTVSVAVALLYTAPAFVVLLSRLRGERFRRAQIAALGLVVVGVFLVTGALRMLATGAATISTPALGFGLASGLTYGLYTLFGKHALERYDPLQTVFWAFASGALCLAAVIPPWEPILAHPDTLPLFLAIGLLPTMAAYLLYVRGLRTLPSSTASMLASAEPVVATLLGVTLLGEPISPDQIAGIALIVAAASVVARG